MKLSKRAGIIGSTIVIVVATTTTGYIMSKPDPKPRNDNAPILIDQKDKSLIPLAVENVTEAPTKPAALPAEDEPAPPTKPATTPGYLRVESDKTSIMTNAQIPADQQVAADAVITKLTGWTYDTPTSVNGIITICNIPSRKFNEPAWQQIKISPTMQLTHCNAYAMSKFGSWQAWLNTL